MPQNTFISVPANTWTLLTDANVTSLTFQVGDLSVASNVLIAGTVGAVPPTNIQSALRYGPQEGEINVALSDLFPGVLGANRVYALCNYPATIFVSHA